ncbi:MAG: glycosyltransferase family 2 protein [Patescibacteria group bacterium]|nr:glycosyltransferase family 2 protein [Patescibacteria group bacterium]MBU2508828.1 glycosyltransferase family 2 protein [Patescibacteria group bacterium]
MKKETKNVVHSTPKKSVVAAIVPAYNEEETIGPVVKALSDSKMFRDIIVISDGSTDRTVELAKKNGATLAHQFPINRGKGAALQHGVAHTDAPIVFFCDADLRGFTIKHIEGVIKPVVDGKLAMNVALRDRGKFFMKIAHHLPLIGGERAMQRHIFENVPDKYLQGFMIESALNYFCRSRGLPYGAVACFGLSMRRKMEKVGFVRGLWGYFVMGLQIAKAMIIVRWSRLTGRF